MAPRAKAGAWRRSWQRRGGLFRLLLLLVSVAPLATLCFALQTATKRPPTAWPDRRVQDVGAATKVVEPPAVKAGTDPPAPKKLRRKPKPKRLKKPKGRAKKPERMETVAKDVGAASGAVKTPPAEKAGNDAATPKKPQRKAEKPMGMSTPKKTEGRARDEERDALTRLTDFVVNVTKRTPSEAVKASGMKVDGKWAGLIHMKSFGGITFRGELAGRRKDAIENAAKAALCGISDRLLGAVAGMGLLHAAEEDEKSEEAGSAADAGQENKTSPDEARPFDPREPAPTGKGQQGLDHLFRQDDDDRGGLNGSAACELDLAAKIQDLFESGGYPKEPELVVNRAGSDMFGGHIIIVDLSKVDRERQEFEGKLWLEFCLRRGLRLAMDVQWLKRDGSQPPIGKQGRNEIGLLQFADSLNVMLVRTHLSGNWLPTTIKNVLASEACTKVTVGFDPGIDGGRMEEVFGVAPAGVVDLEPLAKSKGFVLTGLDHMTKLFGFDVPKFKRSTVKNWCREVLSQRQVDFAVRNAYFTSVVAKLLRRLPTVDPGALEEQTPKEQPKKQRKEKAPCVRRKRKRAPYSVAKKKSK